MSQKPAIMQNPLTNRGTAFTLEERAKYGLTGYLPAAVETLDQQAARAYRQFSAYEKPIEKYIFLDQLHNRNETLYYRLLMEHIAEMLPIVYTPTVGEAIEKWSRDYRRSRAVYLNINRPEEMQAAFTHLGLGAEDVDLIVCSDAEAILGIGDWGVNGTDISVGKLAVYTAAAGIHPERVIAVNLDVGTDNENLLNDPDYLGNRHARVRGERYDAFIQKYIETTSALFPNAILHFEDFSARNARLIVNQYRNQYRVFDDDMQGTSAIVLAAVASGLKVTGERYAQQRLVVFGAGTAGAGMADQISAAMVRDGLSEEEARARVWLIDRNGLVTDDMPNLPDYQQPYARPASEVQDWARTANGISLLETVKRVKPTILIGTSAVHGAFNEEVVRTMAAGVKRPMIFPLSNPTKRIEALPDDIIPWTDGQALIVTGPPTGPVVYKGTTYTIGQGNNSLLFPGLGLGMIVSGAKVLTDNMLIAAAEAVARQVDPSTLGAPILPSVDHLRASSATVAIAVAKQAQADGVATKTSDNWVQTVQESMWQPVYAELAD